MTADHLTPRPVPAYATSTVLPHPLLADAYLGADKHFSITVSKPGEQAETLTAERSSTEGTWLELPTFSLNSLIQCR